MATFCDPLGWAKVHVLLDQRTNREGERSGARHLRLRLVQGGANPSAGPAGLASRRRWKRVNPTYY